MSKPKGNTIGVTWASYRAKERECEMRKSEHIDACKHIDKLQRAYSLLEKAFTEIERLSGLGKINSLGRETYRNQLCKVGNISTTALKNAREILE